MSLVKWDPWREMEDMLDRYTNAVGLRMPRRGSRDIMTGGDWAPRADVTETEREFVIKAELPEIDRKDIHVGVADGVLTISGERRQEDEDSGRTYHLVERHYGSFSRSFSLPAHIDAEHIKAGFRDGLLTLHIPKSEGDRPRGIEIQVE